MNTPRSTARVVSLIASVLVTFLSVQTLAEYGRPAPQASTTIAQAAATPR